MGRYSGRYRSANIPRVIQRSGSNQRRRDVCELVVESIGNIWTGCFNYREGARNSNASFGVTKALSMMRRRGHHLPDYQLG